MHSFPRRVAENILPKSTSGTLPAAFREWYFTGETVDHEIPEERAGSGNLHSGDKWSFCLTSA